MVLKVYVSGMSGNKEVKKRQQRVLMILDSKNVKYDIIDITEPGKESEKEMMQAKSTGNGATVSDPAPRHPLPPQLFNENEYCGDYDAFDLANEIDTLDHFLKLAPADTTAVSTAQIELKQENGDSINEKKSEEQDGENKKNEDQEDGDKKAADIEAIGDADTVKEENNNDSESAKTPDSKESEEAENINGNKPAGLDSNVSKDAEGTKTGGETKPDDKEETVTVIEKVDKREEKVDAADNDDNILSESDKIDQNDNRNLEKQTVNDNVDTSVQEDNKEEELKEINCGYENSVKLSNDKVEAKEEMKPAYETGHEAISKNIQNEKEKCINNEDTDKTSNFKDKIEERTELNAKKSADKEDINVEASEVEETELDQLTTQGEIEDKSVKYKVVNENVLIDEKQTNGEKEKESAEQQVKKTAINMEKTAEVEDCPQQEFVQESNINEIKPPKDEQLQESVQQVAEKDNDEKASCNENRQQESLKHEMVQKSGVNEEKRQSVEKEPEAVQQEVGKESQDNEETTSNGVRKELSEVVEKSELNEEKISIDEKDEESALTEEETKE